MQDCTYSVAEFREVPLNDGLDDFTVDIGQPDTHLGSQDQEKSQNDDVL